VLLWADVLSVSFSMVLSDTYSVHGSVLCTPVCIVCRVMPLVREYKLFTLSAKLVALLYSFNVVAVSHLFKICEALAMIVDTEDYNTYTAQYFDVKDSDDVEQLMKLHAVCTKEFQNDSTYRGGIRPLMDALNKVKRQASRK
jgi:hypothetical protein